MLSGRDIAFPIEACVTMLLECGMQEEVRNNKCITSVRSHMTNAEGTIHREIYQLASTRELKFGSTSPKKKKKKKPKLCSSKV